MIDKEKLVFSIVIFLCTCGRLTSVFIVLLSYPLINGISASDVFSHSIVSELI